MEITCLSIQIQLDRNPDFNKEDFLSRVRRINRFPEIDEAADNGTLNFNFFTESLSVLWQELKSGLYDDEEYGPIINGVSIVVCEDSQGCSDYVLLRHYDESEKTNGL